MGIADDELRMLMSRFPTPFTSVHRCWKHAKNLPLCATFWRASRFWELDLRRGMRSPRKHCHIFR
jgi:hypothetical protein